MTRMRGRLGRSEPPDCVSAVQQRREAAGELDTRRLRGRVGQDAGELEIRNSGSCRNVSFQRNGDERPRKTRHPAKRKI